MTAAVAAPSDSELSAAAASVLKLFGRASSPRSTGADDSSLGNSTASSMASSRGSLSLGPGDGAQLGDDSAGSHQHSPRQSPRHVFSPRLEPEMFADGSRPTSPGSAGYTRGDHQVATSLGGRLRTGMPRASSASSVVLAPIAEE